MINIIVTLMLSLAISVNAFAVDLPLVGIDGKTSNLSDYNGRWVVVNYWATWCPPCREEMPELQAFHDANSDRGALVIGINIENVGKQQLISFLQSHSIHYPIFRSPPIRESSLGSIPGLPTTFLISPKNEVVARQVGPVTRKMIEQFIKKWKPPEMATAVNGDAD